MNIQASLNLGISVAHKRAFPKTIPIKWPILTKKKPNEWLDLLLVKDVFFINQNWRNISQKVTYLVCDWRFGYSKELIGRVRQATRDVVKSEV